MIAKLQIPFPDQSISFTLGVEFGRILEKMERGDLSISNNGFPVHVENIEVISMACRCHGYTPVFGKVSFDEWQEFLGVKKLSNDC